MNGGGGEKSTGGGCAAKNAEGKSQLQFKQMNRNQKGVLLATHTAICTHAHINRVNFKIIKYGFLLVFIDLKNRPRQYRDGHRLYYYCL